MIPRRRALAGFLAAPAIVRIGSIMPVRTPPLVQPGPFLKFYNRETGALLKTVTLTEPVTAFGTANTIAAYRYLMELPMPPFASLLRPT
jgi:hypothetical protein